MKIFLAALVFLGIALFIMCFNILFRKNGEFPDSEIGHSKELRKRGIVCAKEDELKLWGKSSASGAVGCSGVSCGECSVPECLKYPPKDSSDKENH